MPTTLSLVSLTVNTSSTSVEAAATYNDGFTVACDDLSKLILQGYNSDTGVATVSINAATSGSVFIAKGIGALSTSIGSSEYRVFGPFESVRFKSTNLTVVINSTSTCSTNVTFRAYQLP